MHIIESEHISHYGVLGMRWGIRRGSKRGLRKPGGGKYSRKEIGVGLLSAMGKSAVTSATLSGALGLITTGTLRGAGKSAAISAAIGVALTAVGNAPIAYKSYKEADN